MRRLQSMYASLPPSPPSNSRPTKHLTTVLSARLFHSLSSPPWDVPSDDSESSRRRAMQLILDEVHALQKEWQVEGTEWAGAGIINSSKVLVVTVSQLGQGYHLRTGDARLHLGLLQLTIHSGHTTRCSPNHRAITTAQPRESGDGCPHAVRALFGRSAFNANVSLGVHTTRL